MHTQDIIYIHYVQGHQKKDLAHLAGGSEIMWNMLVNATARPWGERMAQLHPVMLSTHYSVERKSDCLFDTYPVEESQKGS